MLASRDATRTRGARRARRAFVRSQLLSDNPESRPVLCYLITFLELAEIPAVEITSRLFGGAGAGGEPSVVAKMVLDAIKATKIEGLARRPGEAWVELLRFARARRAMEQGSGLPQRAVRRRRQALARRPTGRRRVHLG